MSTLAASWLEQPCRMGLQMGWIDGANGWILGFNWDDPMDELLWKAQRAIKLAISTAWPCGNIAMQNHNVELQSKM